MSVPFIILSVVEAVICIGLISVILMQSKRASGLAGMMGGGINMGSGSSSQTYWDKNKGRSLEGMLERYTKIGAVAFFVITMLLNFVK